jgi:acetoin utilization deacetylase AcuC-like enzyme
MGNNHPEQPARLQVIDKELSKSDLNTDLRSYEAPLVAMEHLLRVHSKKHIDAIFQASPEHEGIIAYGPDVYMNRYSLKAALHAAGAGVLAVDLVMNGVQNQAFCNVRPPGHHAEREQAMGFCFFNNIAVAVAYALEQYKLERVAIIDFDVHHGNGTEDIFQNDPRVLFCSSFEHPFYPFSGADTINPHIINIPLPAGTAKDTFREMTSLLWFDRIKAFKPEMLFFSAGFDAYIDDDIADFLLKEEDFFWITDQIKKIANDSCQGRIVSILEGGYSLAGLGKCVAAHLKALI